MTLNMVEVRQEAVDELWALRDEVGRLRTELDSAVLHRISEFARENRDYGNKAVADYLCLSVHLVKETRERLRAGGFDV